jgi:hypothetical protein
MFQKERKREFKIRIGKRRIGFVVRYRLGWWEWGFEWK